MNQIYIKPDLNIFFAAMPLIGIYLRSEYEKARSNEDLLNLTHKWFNESDRTNNEVKKLHYSLAAKRVYTLLTGKTYESKNI